MLVAIVAEVTGCAASPSPRLASVVIRPLPPAPLVVGSAPEIAPPLSPIPVDERDMSWGRDDAPVTVVVFADMVSPYMAREWGTMVSLRAAYPPERLRIVVKHFPLDEMFPTSPLASEAAQGVFVLSGPDVAWKFLGLAFATREYRDKIARDELVAWAGAAGVTDVAALEHGLDAHQWAGKLEHDLTTARHISVDGSPQAFVNGVRLQGAQPLDAFKTAIDAELAAARELLDAGTPPRLVSASRTRRYFASAAFAGTDRFDPATLASAAATALARPTYAMPIDGALTLGPATALVTVVAFGDPGSRSCSFVRERLDGLHEIYGDDVRVVWRSLTNQYPSNRTDAEANFLAETRAQKGDVAAWLALERFCEAGEEGGPRGVPPFDALAGELGLDVAKVHRAIKTRAHEAAIEVDTNLAEDFAPDDLGGGAFTLFIDGHQLAGKLEGIERPELVYDEDVFGRLLEQELNRSRALLRSGVTRDHLYATKLATALPPPALAVSVDVPAPAAMPSSGPTTATLVVQEILSLPCDQGCAEERQAFRNALGADARRIRIVTRVHALEGPAAEAALEVFAQRGPSGFSKFLALLAPQPAWPRAQLDDAARRIGLDMRRYASALDGHIHATEATANEQLARQAHFIQTGYIVGDRPVAAPQRAERYRTLVGRALAAAR